MKKRSKIQIIMPNRYVIHFIVFILILFLPALFGVPVSAQDAVHSGLEGERSNNYGEFYAVKVWKREEVREGEKREVTYACCATSKGMVVIDIDRLSVVSFIPHGECEDLEIRKAKKCK